MWPLSQGAVLADVPDILHSPLFPHQVIPLLMVALTKHQHLHAGLYCYSVCHRNIMRAKLHIDEALLLSQLVGFSLDIESM